MEAIIKIGIFAVLGVLLALQFKSTKPEYATFIGITLGIFIFGYALNQLGVMLGSLYWLKEVFEGSQEYLAILIKIIGITYICEFSSAICKDAGFSTVAEQIEVIGKLAIMFAGMPILLALLELIQGYTA